jgi:hypothetical protein
MLGWMQPLVLLLLVTMEHQFTRLLLLLLGTKLK